MNAKQTTNIHDIASDAIDTVTDIAVDGPPSPSHKLTRKETLLQLFLSTLYISAFTFGGGFVIITFMKRKFVDQLHWITESEMLDLTALAQSAPGAIAVNAAILVGWQVAGITGMAIAVLGTIIPPMSILIAVSYFYVAFSTNQFVALVLQGMQAGVAAVIFDVVFDLGGKVFAEKDTFSITLMIACFIAACFFGINVVFIILTAAALGCGRAVYHMKKAVSV